MSPINVETVSNEDSRYSIPFLGSLQEKLSEKLDVSALGTTHVDSDGFLIPGLPLKRNDSSGLLEPIDGGAQTARGIVLEAVKVADDNESATLSAASDIDVVIVTAGTVDRAIAEYNLDRDYTANELTAISNSGKFTLTEPES